MKVTATELKNRLGRYLLEAMRKEVFITKTGVTGFVLMSYEEYLRLKKCEESSL